MRSTSDLVRPVPVAAALLLVLNDHVLKGAGLLPGWLTGKLSDVTGLFVATILGVTALRVFRPAIPRDGRAATAVGVLIAIAFTALKLWPAFNTAVASIFGENRLDATDLFALPAIPLARLWLADRGADDADDARPFLGGIAFTSIALACMATSRAPPVAPRPVPGWTLHDNKREIACGQAIAWVAKSGKTGFGVTVQVASATDAPCDATITSARLRFPDGRDVVGHEVSVASPPGTARYHYLAFELDNNASWNEGKRTATLELELDLGLGLAPDPHRTSWAMPARHVLVKYRVNER